MGKTKLRELRPYQCQAIEYLLTNPRAALYLDMRLGKSIVTIRALEQIDAPGNVLVVAPMVGLWTWRREIELEKLPPPAILLGSQQERMTATSAGRWHLINYEGLRACPQLLQSNWSAIVLDESRRIANPKAAITKVLQAYPQERETRRILLSGSPASEGPHEYFEQFRWLYGRFLGCKNFWQFRNYFFNNAVPFEWIPKPSAISRIKKEVHSKAFVLSRKDAGIKDEKIYERRVVQLNPKARKLYKEIKRDFQSEWKGKEIFTKWVPVKYMWLQQIASGFLGEELIDDGKLKELISLLQGELAAEPVVVWFRFNAGLFEAKRLLDQARITNRHIVGSVKPLAREHAIDLFRAGTVRILLCQIKAAKESIDLSNSSTAIYFSNSHSLDERVQSEDRIFNPAKQGPFLYLDLVAEKTLDEDIVELLVDKKVEARFFLSTLLKKLYANP